jgi:hypothetical protein
VHTLKPTIGAVLALLLAWQVGVGAFDLSVWPEPQSHHHRIIHATGAPTRATRACSSSEQANQSLASSCAELVLSYSS